MRAWSKVGVAVMLLLMVSVPLFATNVTFQVNMAFQQHLGAFNPETDMVVVRGTLNGWAGNDNALTLTDSLYTGTFDVAEGALEYKFVIVGAADVWESVDNRTANVGTDALVIDAVYFNNQGWVTTTNVEVLFSVDMTVQLLNGNFDPTRGDIVVVRGAFNGWGGYANQLTQESGSSVWSGWAEMSDMPVGTAQEYKYVFVVNGEGGTDNWESSDNRSFTPTGEEADNLPAPSGNGFGEIFVTTPYFSNITPDDILTSDLHVSFYCNARAPFYKIADADSFIVDVQTGDTLTNITDVDLAGFFNNWPWGSFPTEDVMLDDGVGEDITAGDTIYSMGKDFFPGAPKAFIFKHGLNGYDVEAGFAQNHQVMLNNDNPNMAIYSVFGSQGTLYTYYLGLVSAPETTPNLPQAFALDQNYPNPFNPTTRISFEIPSVSNVTLKVFNVNGQLVYEQNSAKLTAGHHEFTFSGAGLASGMYMYSIQAGNFSASRKMVLLK